MSIENQIQALLDEAAPLRLLPDDEAEEKGLPRLVDRINALRAKQANGLDAEPVATEEGADAVTKRGPGRPRKAE